MEERAGEAGQYWQNYLRFQADLERDREMAIDDAAMMERMGSLAPEQAAGRRAEAEKLYSEGMKALREGPTYQLLQEEFVAQRDFAQRQYNQQYGSILNATYERRERGPSMDSDGNRNPSPAGYYRIDAPSGGGEESYGRTTYVGTADPRAAVPAFEFAQDMETFFGERFGSEGEPTPAAPNRPSSRSGLRAAAASGGGATPQGIGVGSVYSWY